jgi:methionyl-tRNA formyltransferase
MRVGFAGTPAFAAAALKALLDAGFDVPLVLTKPDRPHGRGLTQEPSPVKVLAVAHGLSLLQPPTLKSGDARMSALAVPLDVLVVAAYGLILPPVVLAWPRHGCLNIHASLLPRWRGAAPIQRAIEAGDAETGVTIMQMDAGLDTGPIADAVGVPIAAQDTAATLTRKLAVAGAAAIVAVLYRLQADGALALTPQPARGATYAAKIDKAEAAIDWRANAAAIGRRVRALDPAPGATATIGGLPVKVWKAEPTMAASPGTPPGAVLAADAAGVVVACGEGALRITELQPAGGRRMDAAAFVAGRRIAAGARFDTQPPPHAPNRGSAAPGG